MTIPTPENNKFKQNQIPFPDESFLKGVRGKLFLEKVFLEKLHLNYLPKAVKAR